MFSLKNELLSICSWLCKNKNLSQFESLYTGQNSIRAFHALPDVIANNYGLALAAKSNLERWQATALRRELSALHAITQPALLKKGKSDT